MIRQLLFCILFISTTPFSFATEQETAPSQEVDQNQEEQYLTWAKKLWESLDRQTGTITLPNTPATLNISEDYYFLNSQDANTVLVDVWGNPPGQMTLGMIFPAQYTPFDPDAWAVTVEYETDGYVSDEDAEKIDYTALLKEMQASTEQASQERVANGYPPISLVGWASEPFYDKTSHKLHWAKEIKFGGSDENTLNYNIRVLGRQGVLVLNYIAGINQKALIEQNLSSVLAMANFDQGHTYDDFDPTLDKVAAYGIGALITGKVLAKTGIFAVLLVFLKKFWVFLIVAIGAGFKKIFFKKKKATEV